jgi:NitT/TauT family transport system substrate-binding protein
VNSYLHLIQRPRFKYLLVFLVIALLLIPPLTVTGCKAEAPEVYHLKVAYSPFTGHAPFFIAQEEGFFTAQGLEVELVKLPAYNQTIPLLANGEIDVTSGPLSAAFINAVAQNLNLKIVAGKEYAAPDGESSALLIRKDLYDSGEINSAAKLKGRKVAIYSVGIISHFTLAKTLATAGLTLQDVEVVQMTSQDALAAFTNRALEASTMGPPELQQAVAMGYAVSLNSINKLMPNFQYGFVTFGDNLLKNNPEAGKRFLVAYLQGIQQLNQGKTKRNLEILGKYLGMDEATLNRAYWTPIFPDARIKNEDILVFQDWLKEIKLIDTKMDISRLVDTSLLDSARKAFKP